MVIEVMGADETLPQRQLRVRKEAAQALSVAVGPTITMGHSENPSKSWNKSSGLSSALGLKILDDTALCCIILHHYYNDVLISRSSGPVRVTLKHQFCHCLS